MSSEKRLTKYLKENYERMGINGRPTYNHTTVLDVDLTLGIVRIHNIDAEQQKMSSQGILFMKWTDILLKWEPSDFGNVESLVLPSDAVWMPDIVLLNLLEPSTLMFEARITVKSNGEVSYSPQYHFTSLCENAEKKELTCPLKFGSWVHSSKQINVMSSNVRADASFYKSSTSYELMTTNSETEKRTFKCCPDEEWTDLTYQVKLKRRPRPEDEEKDNAAMGLHTGSAIYIISLGVLMTVLH